MFLVGGGCPRGERRSEIRSDSKIFRGLNPSADSCRHQKLEQATQPGCCRSRQMQRKLAYGEIRQVQETRQKRFIDFEDKNKYTFSLAPCVYRSRTGGTAKKTWRTGVVCIFYVVCIVDLCALLSSVSFLYI